MNAETAQKRILRKTFEIAGIARSFQAVQQQNLSLCLWRLMF